MKVTGMRCIHRELHSSLAEFNRKIKMQAQGGLRLPTVLNYRFFLVTPTLSFCSPLPKFFSPGEERLREIVVC